MKTAFEHHHAGRRGEAEDICRRVLAVRPSNPAALHLLGLMAHQQGRLRAALELLRRSVAAAPLSAEFQNNYGTALGDAGRFDEAAAAFREAVRLEPTYADAYRNLGVAYTRAGHLTDAAAAFLQAVRLSPDDADTHDQLAAIYHAQGRVEEAVEARRKVVKLRPGDAAAHSDLLVMLHYQDDYDPDAVFAEHLRWAARHAEPWYPAHQLAARGSARVSGSAGTGRPLRVGYVSGDFREHPVPRFFGPLLAAHDRSRVTAVCYCDVKKPDRVTERLRALADEWRDVVDLDDAHAADLVRRDRIDILVDLAGHLDNRRLGVFARKPARVQVTYLGYPDTTGLSTIDYRITDRYHDPPGLTERLHTESLVRLPGCCWVYDPDPGPEEPHAAAAPTTAETPAAPSARQQEGVTFGVFNRLLKATPRMTRLWSEIVAAVPGSRLLVHAADEECAREFFRRQGFGEALEVFGSVPTRAGYLQSLAQADINLDTFPYNGQTTTCDAMWMGIPTVTLAGRTHVSRAGVSLLTAVGLPELVADSPPAYVRVATELASDRPRLAQLREGLRDRLRRSPLADAPRVARALEGAYESMWVERLKQNE